MKRTLLALSIVISGFTAQAQCDPQSYDWGGEPFGVSPNPALGENFDAGTINVPYSDVVYVKAPTSIADIPGAPPLNIAIDSLSLDSITFLIGGIEQNITALGLNVTCNNNGDSPSPCNFLPGGAYCGDISGTPTIAGSFPVKIYATGYFVLETPQALEYTFEDYTIVINDVVSVKETQLNEMSLGNSQPNPASNQTVIPFELTQSGSVQFAVYNLLGETVERRTISGKKGSNTHTYDTSLLKNGVYLYSIQAGDKRLTKRLVVQH
jgi:hypothetical protein